MPTVLSVPLSLSDQTILGSLNLYGMVEGGFDEDDKRLAEAFAGQASAVVANTLAYWAALEGARVELGWSVARLWLAYFALGGVPVGSGFG